MGRNIPVYYVNARGTSLKCSKCGDKLLFAEESRQVRCPSCGLVDRDINAAQNIRDAGLRFSLKGKAGEAMVQERQTEPNPDSRCLSVQLAAGMHEPTS
jgi:transposase